MKATNHQDVYSRVTDKIIEALEQGTRPWSKPWSGGGTDSRISLPVRHNGIPYRGINILLLWGETITKGYASSRWMTFKQAVELGAHVRKGEHGALVVYANKLTKTEANAVGEEVESVIPFLKSYTVFNVEQIDGLPEGYLPKEEPRGDILQSVAQAEAFFAASGARVRHGGDSAYYSPAHDFIQLPAPEAFRSAEDYAATKAHELIHWTSHATRLDRVLGKRFGDDAYAAEELIAELGAAFLSADLGIAAEPREDHAAYLAHWLGVLKADKKAIFTAAAHAQRAADFLHGLQGKEIEDEEEQLAA